MSIVSGSHACECGLVYIGQNGRNLTIRQKEHHNWCVKLRQVCSSGSSRQVFCTENKRDKSKIRTMPNEEKPDNG